MGRGGLPPGPSNLESGWIDPHLAPPGLGEAACRSAALGWHAALSLSKGGH